MYHVYANTKQNGTITAPASMVILRENVKEEEFIFEVNGKSYDVDEDEFNRIFDEIMDIESNFRASLEQIKKCFDPKSITHFKVCTI